MNLLPFLKHILSLNDPHAEAHSDHVDGLATRLAREVGLPSQDVERISFAAAVHDIGKIAINDFILSKPGRYTEAEYLMVQQHAVLGAKMLEKLELDPIITTIVLQHHENFDGTGYPDGLEGQKINPGARILRITDTYDALTTNRGYRRARPHAKAVAMMEADYRLFDPVLLDAFLRMQPERSG